jgi:hypothetical protein
MNTATPDQAMQSNREPLADLPSACLPFTLWL